MAVSRDGAVKIKFVISGKVDATVAQAIANVRGQLKSAGVAADDVSIALGEGVNKAKSGFENLGSTIRATAGRIFAVKAALGLAAMAMKAFNDAEREAAKRVDMWRVASDQIAGFEGAVRRAKEASAGMFTEMEIAKTMANFRQFQISMDDLPRLMENVAKASIRSGEKSEMLIESMTSGLARLSKLRIDNLGVLISSEKLEAKSLQLYRKQAKALDDIETRAVWLAVLNDDLEKFNGNMNLAASATAKVTKRLNTFQDQQDRASRAFMNMEGAGEGAYATLNIFAHGMDFILPKVDDLASGLADITGEAIAADGGMLGFGNAIVAATDAAKDLLDKNVSAWLDGVEKATLKAQRALFGYVGMMQFALGQAATFGERVSQFLPDSVSGRNVDGRDGFFNIKDKGGRKGGRGGRRRPPRPERLALPQARGESVADQLQTLEEALSGDRMKQAVMRFNRELGDMAAQSAARVQGIQDALDETGDLLAREGLDEANKQRLLAHQQSLNDQMLQANEDYLNARSQHFNDYAIEANQILRALADEEAAIWAGVINQGLFDATDGLSSNVQRAMDTLQPLTDMLLVSTDQLKENFSDTGESLGKLLPMIAKSGAQLIKNERARAGIMAAIAIADGIIATLRTNNPAFAAMGVVAAGLYAAQALGAGASRGSGGSSRSTGTERPAESFQRGGGNVTVNLVGQGFLLGTAGELAASMRGIVDSATHTGMRSGMAPV